MPSNNRVLFEKIKTNVINQISSDIEKCENNLSGYNSELIKSEIVTKKQMLDNIDEIVCLFVASVANCCINNGNDSFSVQNEKWLEFFRKMGVIFPKNKNKLYKIFDFLGSPIKMSEIEDFIETFGYNHEIINNIDAVITVVNEWEEFFDVFSGSDVFPYCEKYLRKSEELFSMLWKGYSIEQIMELISKVSLELRFFENITNPTLFIGDVPLHPLSQDYFNRLERWKIGMKKWKEYFKEEQFLENAKRRKEFLSIVNAPVYCKKNTLK